MLIVIAWFSGFLSNPNITVISEKVPLMMTLFLFVGFISGIMIGIFIEANTKEWIIEIKRKQKELLEKNASKT
jgi:hypothetical protein